VPGVLEAQTHLFFSPQASTLGLLSLLCPLLLLQFLAAPLGGLLLLLPGLPRRLGADARRLEKTKSLAPAVRGALKKAAREQRTTTLPEIQQKTGLNQLGRLSYDDQVKLLVAVDCDTSPDSPLWSTLLAATGDGAALRLHRDVDALRLLSDVRGRLHRPW
jgi:hypothetical protein